MLLCYKYQIQNAILWTTFLSLPFTPQLAFSSGRLMFLESYENSKPEALFVIITAYYSGLVSSIVKLLI